MPLGDITNSKCQLPEPGFGKTRKSINAAASKAMKNLWALQATKIQQKIVAGRQQFPNQKVKTKAKAKPRVTAKARGKAPKSSGERMKKAKAVEEIDGKDQIGVKKVFDQPKHQLQQEETSAVSKPVQVPVSTEMKLLQSQMRPQFRSDTVRSVEEQGARLLRSFAKNEDCKETLLTAATGERGVSEENQTESDLQQARGKTEEKEESTGKSTAPSIYRSIAMVTVFVFMCALLHHVVSTFHGLEKTVDTPNVMASSAIVPKDAISVVPQVEILSPASGEAVGFDDDIAETKVIVQLSGIFPKGSRLCMSVMNMDKRSDYFSHCFASDLGMIANGASSVSFNLREISPGNVRLSTFALSPSRQLSKAAVDFVVPQLDEWERPRRFFTAEKVDKTKPLESVAA